MCSTSGPRAGLGFHRAASLPERDLSAGPWCDTGAWPAWEVEVFRLVDFSPVVLGCGQQLRVRARTSRAEQRSGHQCPHVTQAPSTPAQHQVGKSKPFSVLTPRASSCQLPTSQGPLTSSWHLRWSLPPAAGMQLLCPAPAGLIWDHLVPKTLSPVPYIPAQRQWA